MHAAAAALVLRFKLIFARYSYHGTRNRRMDSATQPMQTADRGRCKEAVRQGAQLSVPSITARLLLGFFSSSPLMSEDKRDIDGGIKCTAREVSCHRLRRHPWPIRAYTPLLDIILHPEMLYHVLSYVSSFSI